MKAPALTLFLPELWSAQLGGGVLPSGRFPPAAHCLTWLASGALLHSPAPTPLTSSGWQGWGGGGWWEGGYGVGPHWPAKLGSLPVHSHLAKPGVVAGKRGCGLTEPKTSLPPPSPHFPEGPNPPVCGAPPLPLLPLAALPEVPWHPTLEAYGWA